VPKQGIRIVFIDDHKVVLDALKLLFDSIPDFETIRCFEGFDEAKSFLLNEQVDVLISDLNMPRSSGIELAIFLREHCPSLKILMLTMVEDASQIREAIRAGVKGYVFKKSGKEELEKAVRTVQSGRKYFSEEVIEELALEPDEDLNQASPNTIEQLTPREIEILKLVANEFNTKEIAEKLFVSVPTIETHRGNLMRKLGVKSAIGMTKFAIKHRLID
jgi:DNA-binding NarL/FixJ family response regulator